MQLTNKQTEVFRSFLQENPKILVCSGAKRAGKTFVLTYIFLTHLVKYRDEGLSFILGGASQASIRRNVLNDMERILGKELKLDKTNAVEIFGNKVYCFDGANADTWKKVRGFTSAGAMLNEGTALHNNFVKEVISRCSHEGARIYIDTNPENPAHPVKTDYIDKDGQRLENGQLNIKAFNFSLFDNTFLNSEYVESIIKATPSGMFTDRDIYGKWVKAEGVVYDMFDEELHTYTDDYNYTQYNVSVDYGTQNATVFLLWGLYKDKWYIVDEYCHSGREEGKQKTDKEYTDDLIEFIGSRKVNYIIVDPSAASFKLELKNAGLIVKNANNKILNGIRYTQTLIIQNKIVVNKRCKNLIKEFELYSWDEKAANRGVDEVIKEHDHAMDAMRYFSYTILRRYYR